MPQLESRVFVGLYRALPTLALVLLALFLVACGGAPSGEDEAANSEGGAATATDSAVEVEFWQSVKDSDDADQLLAYIKKYPEGQFIELAEARLKSLNDSEPEAEESAANPPGAAAALPSSSSAPPSNMSRKDQVLSVVRKSLGRYSDERLHIHPNIPQKKADNAAEVHGIDPRSILVLYDDGLRGRGKTGFVITERRMHWRFIAGDDPYYVDFRDIQSAVPQKSKFILNGYDVSTTMSADSRFAAQVYADMAMALSRTFR